VVTTLLHRGVAAVWTALNLGADRAADAVGSATGGIALVVRTARVIRAVATNLLVVEIRWALMTIRGIRARATGSARGAGSAAADFVAAAGGVVLLVFADATGATLLAGRAAPVQIRNAKATRALATCIAVIAILTAIWLAIRIRAGLTGRTAAAFAAAIVIFDTVAGISVPVVADRALGTTETVTTSFARRTAALGADGATVTRLFLRGFVGVGSRRGLRHRCVIQVRVGRARRAHVPVEPTVTRVCRRAGGCHIRQEVAIAGALHAVAGVVADIVVVAGLGEIDVTVGADLVRNDMADEALRRATAIEFRHVTGVRNPIRAEVKVGNRMDRLHATDLATLRGGIIGNAVTSRRGQR